MEPHDPQVMEFADVRKFRFGAPIEASDGTAGKLVCVVAEGSSRAIAAIGVKTGLLGKTHYVPVHQVSDGTSALVTLSIPLEDIEKAPTTTSGMVLNGSTAVSAGGRGIGKLAQLTIHAESRSLRHLVVDRFGGEVLVPAVAITGITARQIALELSTDQAKALTPYRDDDELSQETTKAIYDYVPLRIDLPGFQVVAIDGVIWLKGHVSSDLNRRLIADQFVGVRGAAEVHNDLYADTDVAATVSMALAHDPRTAGEHIGVYPQLGEVHLRGAVTSQEARSAAHQIALATDGVSRVVNELHIDHHAHVLPVLAAVADTEDVVPGGR